MKFSAKALTLPIATLAVAGGLYLTSQPVLAGEAGPEQHETIAQELAERFGLNQSEVQAFFEEKRAERQTERQANFEERLNQLVADNALTEEQKNALLAKHQEEKTEREANLETWRSLSPEERRAAREEHRTEMQTWAEEQGIDLSQLHAGMMEDRGDREGHRFARN